MDRGAISFLAGVGGLLLFGWMLLASRDAPAPRDADLIPADAPVADGDNAYALFLKIKAALPLSQQEKTAIAKRLDGKASPEEASVAEAVIARSTEAAALFAEFSRRPAFQDPAARDLASLAVDAPVPEMGAVVAAARLNSLRADSLEKAGRSREALALALETVDAGRMLIRSRSTLIPNLVGRMLVEIGAKRVLQLVAGGKLDRAGLRDAAVRLSAPMNGAAGIQEALRFLYVEQSHLLDQLPQRVASSRTSGKQDWRVGAMLHGGSFMYQPNRTKELYAARFRILITEAGKPCLQARVPPFEIVPYWRPNMVGRVLYDIAIPQYEKLSAQRCEQEFRLTAAATSAAAAAYRLEHGRFPGSLAELTPGYLPTAPVDPFTGAAPLYSAADGEIHSAGKDEEGKPL